MTSAHIDPFSAQSVAGLLAIRDAAGVPTVVNRESATKEFKESFGWGSLGAYARTMAAFANTRGGYLIFGVADSPRIALGLSARSKDAFDNLDQAKLTAGLNELFSPEIHWEIGVFELAGLSFGAIYTFESIQKPVIARKGLNSSGASVHEGDILYRYNSRTERAKYPEIVKILDEARSREQRALLLHFGEILRAGAANVAVLDFGRASLQGATGQSVLIDEQLLDQVSFIREGEFDEVSGAPTLKVVGQVSPVGAIAVGPERVVRDALTTEDVITDFLDQTYGGKPEAYIRQASTGNTSFLPVHFYRSAAQWSAEELIAFVEGVTTRSSAKAKLLERLRAEDDLREQPPSFSTQFSSTVVRRHYYELLSKGDLASVEIQSADDARGFLGAIRALDDDQVSVVFEGLLELIRDCFERYYGSDGRVADALRRAVCRVDSALYGDRLLP